MQDDKDLVHEFVNRGGLDCLIAVGSAVDQNYQNYILRGIAEVMVSSADRLNIVSFIVCWFLLCHFSSLKFEIFYTWIIMLF